MENHKKRQMAPFSVRSQSNPTAPLIQGEALAIAGGYLLAPEAASPRRFRRTRMGAWLERRGGPLRFHCNDVRLNLAIHSARAEPSCNGRCRDFGGLDQA